MINHDDETWSWGILVSGLVILAVSLVVAWLLIPHGSTGLDLR